MNRLWEKFVSKSRTRLMYWTMFVIIFETAIGVYSYNSLIKEHDENIQFIEDTISSVTSHTEPLDKKSTYETIRFFLKSKILYSNASDTAFKIVNPDTGETLYSYECGYSPDDINVFPFSKKVETNQGNYVIYCYPQISAMDQIPVVIALVLYKISLPVLLLGAIIVILCICSIWHNYKKSPGCIPDMKTDGIYYEIVIALSVILPVCFIISFWQTPLGIVIASPVIAGLFNSAITATAKRLCRHELYSSTFISRTSTDKYLKKFHGNCEALFSLIRKYYLKLPGKIRLLIRLVIFILSEVILYALFKSFLIVAIFATAIFLIYLIYSDFALNKTLENIEKIYSDPVNSRIDGQNLVGTYKRINDNLNNINDNFSDALEQLVKSERLKSELVTNVSHDIKTPLTSIINYVDLLKHEDLDGETARSYIDVLDRQSNRLKKLITDLIEASKAATGQLKVTMVQCDIGIMAEQILGEYEDRLSNAGITPATIEFPKEMYVNADMQCLFRCVDNIMSNICKYSLAGTRMYISFLRDGENTIVTFKNISRDKLDLSPDELMERFVRGDASRSTEGSGLGLSIVSSLMKLMDGELRLEIDGDLFKASLVLKSL